MVATRIEWSVTGESVTLEIANPEVKMTIDGVTAEELDEMIFQLDQARRELRHGSPDER